MALFSLKHAGVPLRNCSLTHLPFHPSVHMLICLVWGSGF